MLETGVVGKVNFSSAARKVLISSSFEAREEQLEHDWQLVGADEVLAIVNLVEGNRSCMESAESANSDRVLAGDAAKRAWV